MTQHKSNYQSTATVETLHKIILAFNSSFLYCNQAFLVAACILLKPLCLCQISLLCTLKMIKLHRLVATNRWRTNSSFLICLFIHSLPLPSEESPGSTRSNPDRYWKRSTAIVRWMRGTTYEVSSSSDPNLVFNASLTTSHVCIFDQNVLMDTLLQGKFQRIRSELQHSRTCVQHNSVHTW